MNNVNENDKSLKNIRPPVIRAISMPNSPISPLADNPWYQQKFEFVC